MKELDFDEPFDILDVVLGAKFYVGNVVQNSIDGSDIKYSESLIDPECLENSGSTKNVNDYSRLLSPQKLHDRSHIQ